MIGLQKILTLAMLAAIATGCNEKSTEPTLQLTGDLSYRSTLALTGFEDNRADILEGQSVSNEDFIRLSTAPAEDLSETDRRKLKNVREAIDKPSSRTLLQKVISLNDIYTYMSNVYGGTLGGYISVAADSKELNNQYNVYWGLRLDYQGTKFSPTGAGYAVIRFYSPLADRLTVPYGAAMGGTTVNSWPWTGGGFTSSKLGTGGIPEYTFPTYSAPEAGAELYEVTPNGTEILRSRFVDNEWQTNEPTVSKAPTAGQPIRNGLFVDSKGGEVLITTLATYGAHQFTVRGLVGGKYHLTTTDASAARELGLEVLEKGIYGISVDLSAVENLHEVAESSVI